MGTRGLTCVVLDGKMKVANYQQWDSYLSGQGKTIIDFIANKMDIKKFKKAVSECCFISEDEIHKTWVECGADDSGMVSLDISEKHSKLYPGLSRDTGAQILSLIQDGKYTLLISENGKRERKDFEVAPVRKLQDSYNFAADSLFCEYAYVLDLDNKVLEIYKGFNENKPEGRFANMPRLKEDDGTFNSYYPVTLLKKISFKDCKKKDALEKLIKYEKEKYGEEE